MKFKDLTGKKFGFLKVLGYSHTDQNGRQRWNCLCTCGNKTVVRSDSLKDGSTKSCGKIHVNNIVEIDNKTIGIIIKSPKHGQKICLIDKEDYDKVKDYRWYLMANYNYQNNIKFYVQSESKGYHVKLHRLLITTDKQVDHKNGNGLDNRKENLREATNLQNSQNKEKQNYKGKKLITSKYKGVWWCKTYKTWVSQIGLNYKRISLGRFKTEIEAAQAYNEAAVKYFGKFARLNKI